MKQNLMFNDEPEANPVDQSVDHRDVSRLKGQNKLLYELLMDCGFITSGVAWEFYKIKRLSARIFDLKERYGLNIKSERLPGGDWKYTHIKSDE